VNVLGEEISQEVIDRALLSFPPERSFRLSDLRGALIKAGVPWRDGIPDRAADRILQNARKAGTHTFSGGLWRRRKITAASE
jgi:hypothetical protein